MRDRLIELLKSCLNDETIETDDGYVGFDVCYNNVADYLIENGVIVPKYKIGDRVWYITGIHRSIVKSTIVDEIIVNCNGVSDLFVTSDTGSFENSVDIFYPTKETAEKALRGEGE